MNREPIRCFEGDAKPHEAFWKFRDAVDGQETELELYGYISEYSWFEDDVTPKKFKDDLNRYGKGGPITIRMNSYGGEVIAASLMSTIIKDYPGKVTVQIDGVAASAATLVAIAGDVVRMQETAYFMIHDPSVIFMMAQLNIEDLTRLASSLAAVKEGAVNAYETRTGLSRARLSKLMTEETWMDAQKAVDLGFVDEIIRTGKPIPVDLGSKAAVVNALRNFNNVPPGILQALNSINVPPEAVSSEPLLTEDMQREAQSLRDRVKSILRKEKPNA
jgi:ATP-dependent Clp protease protease subunit